MVERTTPTRFSELVGWSEEDHVAAVAAFAATCAPDPRPTSAGGYGSYGPAVAIPSVCEAARRAGRLSEAEARRFFETRFRLERIEGEGRLTAYFSPVYPARTRPDSVFSEPVRPRPPGLPRNPVPGQIGDRAVIEQSPSPNAVGWMRAEDLFFLQIQGSGVLVFDDGRRARAVFDGSNGAPFVGVAAPMRQAGLLPDRRTSGGDIHAWLADHRGPDAKAVMDQNPRYVFFRLAPDSGAEPAGAAGRPLVPGRSVAVDPAWHAMGELLWIEATTPRLAGAPTEYRRLVVALDTGSAIKGEVRADLYTGRGDAAGAEAGRVRHTLHLYRLEPLP